MQSPAMEAVAACARLLALSESSAQRGRVHSVFDHAVNLEFGDRLISVLQSPRGLVPYGCTVEMRGVFPEAGMTQGMQAIWERNEIRLSNGLCIRLTNAASVELSVEAIGEKPITNHLSSNLRQVQNLLQAEGGTDGLSVLVTDNGTNVYADFLRPRLPALYAAVETGDAEAAVNAAKRIAGCGVGLTPSSDDLLTGYLIAIRLLCRTGRLRDIRAWLPRMAAAAAEKTNRISGAFLRNSGDGLASEDFLSLVKAGFFTADADAVAKAASRVAQFGSTSGRDMLTGLVLAIQHHDGGKQQW